MLDHMASQDWWLQHILIKCPNSVTRQMFLRLLMVMITTLSKSTKQYIDLRSAAQTQPFIYCRKHHCLTAFVLKVNRELINLLLYNISKLPRIVVVNIGVIVPRKLR